jgi:hypothetical protein
MSTNLTDDELMAMWFDESVPQRGTREFVCAYARAAIAADRSRRASSAAAVPAEPVAHICILNTKDAGPTKFFTAPSDPRGFPVYATPTPPAPPQGEQEGPWPCLCNDRTFCWCRPECERAPVAPAEPEREMLRSAQAAAVMPMIGPLLDAWEGADRDAMADAPALAKHLRLIARAMETAGDADPIDDAARQFHQDLAAPAAPAAVDEREIQRLRDELQLPGAEPDMRHPKIQRLIGSNARKDIEMSLVEQLIDDPDCDLTSMDMEYWNSTHDKLREALLAADKREIQRLRDELPRAHGIPAESGREG